MAAQRLCERCVWHLQSLVFLMKSLAISALATVISLAAFQDASAFNGAKVDYGAAEITYEFDGIEASLTLTKLDQSGVGTYLTSTCRKGRPNRLSGNVGDLRANKLVKDRLGYTEITLETNEQFSMTSVAGNQTGSGFSFFSSIDLPELEKLVLAFYDLKMIIVSYEEGNMAEGFQTSNLVLQGNTHLKDDAKRNLGGFLQTCKLLGS